MLDLPQFKKAFPHTPTFQQQELFRRLGQFLEVKNNKSLFLVRGYAGTGKTTVLSALVKLLPGYKLKSVLMAPTGRAAKVISVYAQKEAFTIHKLIYRKKDDSDSASFVRAPNAGSDTVFIVDEASMISNRRSEGLEFSGTQLLSDLMEFVYNEKNCKLILVGDTAQLPPVGLDKSPALDADYLEKTFDVQVEEMELTEVLRQEKLSGILENATRIRELIRIESKDLPQIVTRGYTDTFRMGGDKLTDGLNYAYAKYGVEETLLITRSNKGANRFNQEIRGRILEREEEIAKGDYLMVVKNNYYWLEDGTGQSFIANGDTAKVDKIKGIHEKYGFRFADVVLSFSDYPNEPPLSCKIMLDTLTSEAPNLRDDDSKRLYEAVSSEYSQMSRLSRAKKMKEDEYYNALQVKFAYAVTCHKAQGGQWKAVFVDQGYLTAEMLNQEFLRWLYTAVSRSSQELFLVNFGKQFFE